MYLQFSALGVHCLAELVVGPSGSLIEGILLILRVNASCLPRADKARHIIEEASKKAKKLALETDDLRKQARIFRQKLQVMMESQLEVVKGSEWDEILQQGETTSYEAIQEAIRRDETLDKEAAKEVKSFSNDSEDDVYYQNAVEDGEVDDSEEADAVVVFPESDVDAGGQHFADEAEENM